MPTIKRRALLIGNSSVEPPLPGVARDIEKYEKYLLSDNGGAWEKNEIIISLNENNTEIIKKINEFNNIDYAFILVSGHGEHRKDYSGNNETFFWHSDKHAEPVKNYFPKVKRSVIIVDVCRVLRVVKSLSEDQRIKYATSFASKTLTREEYRKKFDDHIMSCPESRIVTYSCDINQSAGEDSNGGIFSVALLNSFEHNNSGNIVNIFDAFQIAKKNTEKNNYPQSPTIDKGREREFFPFGIS